MTWSLEARLFEILSEHKPLSVSEIVAASELTEAGADALLGVLCALELVVRDESGGYLLSRGAAEYFRADSPYFIGGELYSPKALIPGPYKEKRPSLRSRLHLRLVASKRAARCGTMERLTNQHVRNLPGCVTAVASGEFNGCRRIMDIAGGSGTFAIPALQADPALRIVLLELPDAIRRTRVFLNRHGVADRVELRGTDITTSPWKVPPCDGAFIGNILCAFDDSTCVAICREAYEHLEPGGKIFIHEILWNDEKTGPLLTAVWNAAMRVGGGRQRTARELTSMLGKCGFADPYVVPTAGGFSLVTARKP